MSRGKLERLQALSGPDGIIRALAMDQRDWLRKAIAKAKDVDPSQITGHMLSHFKVAVSEVLSPYASAILLDPEFGLEAAGKRGQGVGLLLAYEQSGHDESDSRMPRLLPNWNVQRFLECGADAIKLLVYYNPFDKAVVNDVKRDLVKQVGAECARSDMPFFLEPIGYLPGINQKSLGYVRLKPSIIEAMIEEFSRPEYSVDVLKVEAPVNMEFVQRTTAFRGAKAYTREEARHHFLAVASTTSKPFIYLSGGVSIGQFQETLQLAVESGARFSGVLCGRAIWQGGIEHYAKGGIRGLSGWLRAEGVQNIQAVNKRLSRLH